MQFWPLDGVAWATFFLRTFFIPPQFGIFQLKFGFLNVRSYHLCSIIISVLCLILASYSESEIKKRAPRPEQKMALYGTAYL